MLSPSWINPAPVSFSIANPYFPDFSTPQTAPIVVRLSAKLRYSLAIEQIAGRNELGMYKSTDSGTTWTRITNPLAVPGSFWTQPNGVYGAITMFLGKDGLLYVTGATKDAPPDSGTPLYLVPFQPSSDQWQPPITCPFLLGPNEDDPQIFAIPRSDGSLLVAHQAPLQANGSSHGSPVSYDKVAIEKRDPAGNWTTLATIDDGNFWWTDLQGATLTLDGILHVFVFRSPDDGHGTTSQDIFGLYHVSVSPTDTVSAPQLIEDAVEIDYNLDYGQGGICAVKGTEVVFPYVWRGNTNFSNGQYGATRLARGAGLNPVWTIEHVNDTNAPIPSIVNWNHQPVFDGSGTLWDYWISPSPAPPLLTNPAVLWKSSKGPLGWSAPAVVYQVPGGLPSVYPVLGFAVDTNRVEVLLQRHVNQPANQQVYHFNLIAPAGGVTSGPGSGGSGLGNNRATTPAFLCAPPNRYDLCLAQEMRLAVDLLPPPPRCRPRSERSYPWIDIPEQARPLNKAGAIPAPAPASGFVPVLSFYVQFGFDGILNALYQAVAGLVYNQGSGDLAWRLQIGRWYAKGFSANPVALGSPQEVYPLPGGFRLRSDQKVTFAVQNNNAGAIPPGVGMILCGVRGWSYPRE